MRLFFDDCGFGLVFDQMIVLRRIHPLSTSPMVNLRDDLSINPWLFKDPEFLLRVGADLGSIGRVDLGIQFTLRSIKKDPKNLVAVLRGTDVDQPRNLAKSVTVE